MLATAKRGVISPWLGQDNRDGVVRCRIFGTRFEALGPEALRQFDVFFGRSAPRGLRRLHVIRPDHVAGERLTENSGEDRLAALVTLGCAQSAQGRIQRQDTIAEVHSFGCAAIAWIDSQGFAIRLACVSMVTKSEFGIAQA